MVGAAVILLTVGSVAACSSVATGQAEPTDTTRTGSPASFSLPPRPTTISMNGVDPCALLTAAQQARFQVKAGEKAPVAAGETGAVCQYDWAESTAGPGGYGVSAITSPGIEFWLDQNDNATINQTTIAGFPAVDVQGDNQDTGCTTSVSVADGQVLEIDNGLLAQGMTSAQSCAKTNAVAEAAMTTLQTLR
jgi:uncharacterized protein DUF3558